MRAGNLRDKITIQKNTKATDAKGVYVNAWTTRVQPWAEVSIDSGLADSDEIARQVTTGTFRIRYDSSVLPEDRILWNSRYFEITGLAPDQRKTELVITAREAS